MKKYAILCGSRTGSSYLCNLLRSTNRCGKPSEFFNLELDFPSCKHKLIKKYKTENEVFGVKIVGMERGRSAAKYKAISVINNNHYIVFMRDLLEMLPALDSNCHIKGGFVVRKRGRNFGLGLAKSYKVGDVNWNNRVNVIPEYV